jgi:peptidoglycan hydrolase-like protein with peptidoglycan-binding domain
VRESISSGRGSAVLREPNFGGLFESAKRPRKLRAPKRQVRAGLLRRIGGRRLADLLAGLVAAAAILLVFVNALGLQRAPHHRPVSKHAVSEKARKHAAPVKVTVAPLPPSRPEPARRSQADLVLDIQRELLAKGYYTGAIDGLAGPKAVQAIRTFEQTEGLKVTGEPSESLLEKIRRAGPRSDITGSLTPADTQPTGARIASVQRVLARLGFGPVRINGELDRDTRAAVMRFQRERNLPPSGEISDRVVSELADFSGRPLD